jgi:uncharacterized protein (DUF1697 family)
MPNYVAMIRGVGPENPNMRGEKLKWAFESLGFTDVRPFLTSGNVIFTSSETDHAKLEQTIEAALPKLLDFSRDVLVRSQSDLQHIVDTKPFGDLQHQNAGETYLTITFFKSLPKFDFKLPYQPEGKHFQFVATVDGALCSVVDLSNGKTTNLMSYLERQYGKQITTRTYNTVTRLLLKMSSA